MKCLSLLVLLKSGRESGHVGEAFHRLGKAFDGFICVSMFDAVADTVADMTLQNHLLSLIHI